MLTRDYALTILCNDPISSCYALTKPCYGITTSRYAITNPYYDPITRCNAPIHLRNNAPSPRHKPILPRNNALPHHPSPRPRNHLPTPR